MAQIWRGRGLSIRPEAAVTTVLCAPGKTGMVNSALSSKKQCGSPAMPCRNRQQEPPKQCPHWRFPPAGKAVFPRLKGLCLAARMLGVTATGSQGSFLTTAYEGSRGRRWEFIPGNVSGCTGQGAQTGHSGHLQAPACWNRCCRERKLIPLPARVHNMPPAACRTHPVLWSCLELALKDGQGLLEL